MFEHELKPLDKDQLRQPGQHVRTTEDDDVPPSVLKRLYPGMAKCFPPGQGKPPLPVPFPPGGPGPSTHQTLIRVHVRPEDIYIERPSALEEEVALPGADRVVFDLLQQLAWQLVWEAARQLLDSVLPSRYGTLAFEVRQEIAVIYGSNASYRRKISDVANVLIGRGSPTGDGQEDWVRQYLRVVGTWLKKAESTFATFTLHINQFAKERTWMGKLVEVVRWADDVLVDEVVVKICGKPSVGRIRQNIAPIKTLFEQAYAVQSLPAGAQLEDYLNLLLKQTYIPAEWRGWLAKAEQLSAFYNSRPYPKDQSVEKQLIWFMKALSDPGVLREANGILGPELVAYLEMLAGVGTNALQYPREGGPGAQMLWMFRILDRLPGVSNTPAHVFVNCLNTTLGGSDTSRALFESLLSMSDPTTTWLGRLHETGKHLTWPVGRELARHVAPSIAAEVAQFLGVPKPVMRVIAQTARGVTQDTKLGEIPGRMLDAATTEARDQAIGYLAGNKEAARTLHLAKILGEHQSFEESVVYLISEVKESAPSLQVIYEFWLNKRLIWEISDAFQAGSAFATEDKLRKIARVLKDIGAVASFQYLDKLIDLIPLLPALYQARRELAVQSMGGGQSWLEWGEDVVTVLENHPSPTLQTLRDQLLQQLADWIAQALMSGLAALGTASPASMGERPDVEDVSAKGAGQERSWIGRRLMSASVENTSAGGQASWPFGGVEAAPVADPTLSHMVPVEGQPRLDLPEEAVKVASNEAASHEEDTSEDAAHDEAASAWQFDTPLTAGPGEEEELLGESGWRTAGKVAAAGSAGLGLLAAMAAVWRAYRGVPPAAGVEGNQGTSKLLPNAQAQLKHPGESSPLSSSDEDEVDESTTEPVTAADSGAWTPFGVSAALLFGLAGAIGGALYLSSSDSVDDLTSAEIGEVVDEVERWMGKRQRRDVRQAAVSDGKAKSGESEPIGINDFFEHFFKEPFRQPEHTDMMKRFLAHEVAAIFHEAVIVRKSRLTVEGMLIAIDIVLERGYLVDNGWMKKYIKSVTELRERILIELIRLSDQPAVRDYLKNKPPRALEILKDHLSGIPGARKHLEDKGILRPEDPVQSTEVPRVEPDDNGFFPALHKYFDIYLEDENDESQISPYKGVKTSAEMMRMVLINDRNFQDLVSEARKCIKENIAGPRTHEADGIERAGAFYKNHIGNVVALGCNKELQSQELRALKDALIDIDEYYKSKEASESNGRKSKAARLYAHLIFRIRTEWVDFADNLDYTDLASQVKSTEAQKLNYAKRIVEEYKNGKRGVKYDRILVAMTFYLLTSSIIDREGALKIDQTQAIKGFSGLWNELDASGKRQPPSAQGDLSFTNFKDSTQFSSQTDYMNQFVDYKKKRSREEAGDFSKLIKLARKEKIEKVFICRVTYSPDTNWLAQSHDPAAAPYIEIPGRVAFIIYADGIWQVISFLSGKLWAFEYPKSEISGNPLLRAIKDDPSRKPGIIVGGRDDSIYTSWQTQGELMGATVYNYFFDKVWGSIVESPMAEFNYANAALTYDVKNPFFSVNGKSFNEIAIDVIHQGLDAYAEAAKDILWKKGDWQKVAEDLVPMYKELYRTWTDAEHEFNWMAGIEEVVLLSLQLLMPGMKLSRNMAKVVAKSSKVVMDYRAQGFRGVDLLRKSAPQIRAILLKSGASTGRSLMRLSYDLVDPFPLDIIDLAERPGNILPAPRGKGGGNAPPLGNGKSKKGDVDEGGSMRSPEGRPRVPFEPIKFEWPTSISTELTTKHWVPGDFMDFNDLKDLEARINTFIESCGARGSGGNLRVSSMTEADLLQKYEADRGSSPSDIARPETWVAAYTTKSGEVCLAWDHPDYSVGGALDPDRIRSTIIHEAVHSFSNNHMGFQAVTAENWADKGFNLNLDEITTDYIAREISNEIGRGNYKTSYSAKSASNSESNHIWIGNLIKYLDENGVDKGAIFRAYFDSPNNLVSLLEGHTSLLSEWQKYAGYSPLFSERRKKWNEPYRLTIPEPGPRVEYRAPAGNIGPKPKEPYWRDFETEEAYEVAVKHYAENLRAWREAGDVVPTLESVPYGKAVDSLNVQVYRKTEATQDIPQALSIGYVDVGENLRLYTAFNPNQLPANNGVRRLMLSAHGHYKGTVGGTQRIPPGMTVNYPVPFGMIFNAPSLEKMLGRITDFQAHTVVSSVKAGGYRFNAYKKKTTISEVRHTMQDTQYDALGHNDTPVDSSGVAVLGQHFSRFGDDTAMQVADAIEANRKDSTQHVDVMTLRPGVTGEIPQSELFKAIRDLNEMRETSYSEVDIMACRQVIFPDEASRTQFLAKHLGMDKDTVELITSQGDEYLNKLQAYNANRPNSPFDGLDIGRRDHRRDVSAVSQPTLWLLTLDRYDEKGKLMAPYEDEILGCVVGGRLVMLSSEDPDEPSVETTTLGYRCREVTAKMAGNIAVRQGNWVRNKGGQPALTTKEGDDLMGKTVIFTVKSESGQVLAFPFRCEGNQKWSRFRWAQDIAEQVNRENLPFVLGKGKKAGKRFEFEPRASQYENEIWVAANPDGTPWYSVTWRVDSSR